MMSGGPVQAVDLGVVSHPGRVRPRNEDAYGYEALYDPQGQLTGWIFVVADGVGGEFHGDIASHMAVRGIIDLYKSLTLQTPLMPPAEKLKDAIQSTNGDIYAKAADLNVAGHMGTTVVVGVLRPDGVLTVAWVGDSRLYVISRRLDRIRQVSKDHTEAAELVRQRLITLEQAANHPRRNVLMRSVGGQPETTPEFAEGLLENTDTIVVCTDGLTRYLSPDHIKTLAVQATSSEQAAHQLVGAANQLGGKDNVTALVVHVGSRESQMETIPPVFTNTGQPSLFDTAAYMPVGVYQSTPLHNARKKRDHGVMALNGVLAVILLTLVAGMIILFVSQSPLAAPPIPAANARDTQEAATTDEAALITPTVERTQTAQAVEAGFTQTYDAFNLVATSEAQVDLTVPASTTEVDTSTQTPAETTPGVSVPTPQKTTVAAVVIPAADETPASTATIEAVFADVQEPYPTHMCVATAKEAPVYASVGGDSPYAIPANKVLYIEELYPYKTQGESSNYYMVRSNDGSQGAGWVRGDDLVPARNLTPAQQAGLILLPSMVTVLSQETGKSWPPDQTLVIREDDPAFDINCFPMRLDLASLDAIYIVEVDTQVTVLATAPKSVNGAIWWNVRLPDGREGWIQQIYLDEVTQQ